MSTVTVTATIGTTCHYELRPEPVWSLTGLGVNLAETIRGSVTDGNLSLSLDDTTTYEVRMRFLGAPPVEFDGFDPTGGGDLFDMLSDQGWTPGESIDQIPSVIDGGSA